MKSGATFMLWQALLLGSAVAASQEAAQGRRGLFNRVFGRRKKVNDRDEITAEDDALLEKELAAEASGERQPLRQLAEADLGLGASEADETMHFVTKTETACLQGPSAYLEKVLYRLQQHSPLTTMLDGSHVLPGDCDSAGFSLASTKDMCFSKGQLFHDFKKHPLQAAKLVGQIGKSLGTYAVQKGPFHELLALRKICDGKDIDTSDMDTNDVWKRTFNPKF